MGFKKNVKWWQVKGKETKQSMGKCNFGHSSLGAQFLSNEKKILTYRNKNQIYDDMTVICVTHY